ncbi:MAG: N-acetyl sugar amidotransferase [Verrucomicrobia bacterium]|jgi:N-acetyl sugar amidotransferase|nr:N-acetyl sugar amidotransferase [Verrucomicrobiota bacterium]
MLPSIHFPPVELPRHNVQSLYKLPDEVKYCTRCVISNQRPRITFNEQGVCSACQFAEVKKGTIDWAKREEELQTLCDKHRRNDGRFDVVVPCSGGKDSGYVSHILKTKYGMHPLTVTWAPHWYTDIGRENLSRLIHSGLSNVCFTPDGRVHRLMTRLAFIVLGDPFQPFIYGQKNFPLTMAVQYDIPLIMYGENGEVEYGGDMKNAFKPTHDTGGDMVKHYFSGISPEKWAKHGVNGHDLSVYCGPSQEKLKEVGVECHFMGYYHQWIPQALYYYCAEHTGFQANPDGRSQGTYSKYASLDDRLDGFHYYLAYIKFGIGRCTSDAAHEVRDGHITREEAVALVKRFDGEFPRRHYQEFLDYTGLSDDEFNNVVDNWRGLHLWTKTPEGWSLNKPVWES